MGVTQGCTRSVIAGLGVAIALIATSIAPALASQCKLHKFAEFPVTMVGLQPIMTAKINDEDVRLLLDSGAFYSFLTEASAAQLKLKKFASPLGPYVLGINGAAAVSVATVKTFALPGATLHDVEFMVTGGEVGHGSVGVLGQNFLHLGDIEYDLGQGMVRLMNPEDCSATLLAYWAKESDPYSEIHIEAEAPMTGTSTGTHMPAKKLQLARTIGHAYVNGVEIRVEFDTGSSTSILSARAAARAGIKIDSPGAVSGGVGSGIGKGTFATYIVPVASFKIGDEEIKRTRLRVGDIDWSEADMLIGADFFLSHRIFVANSQQKLYFTYNGGPVFDLTTGMHPVGDTTAPVKETAVNGSLQQHDDPAAQPDTAADFARRGAALAARREFAQALTALTRACELAPDDPDYAYQRGMIHWQLKEPDAAKAEFDRAIELKPADVTTRLARARLTFQQGDKTAAIGDLDAAATVLSKGADERLELAHAYESADLLAPAVTQLTLWIDSHPVDARFPSALNSRCWLRALEGAELPQALKDCDAALKRAQKASSFYAKVSDSRGLVFLRQGDYDKSIADYDASLEINPKSVWSLYGRGVDKLRKHDATAGNADIASAQALSPQIADEFKRRGIVP